MSTRISETSPLLYARVAGIGYLIIIIGGIFAEFLVRSSLIVPGDAASTATNIMASQSLFRIGIAGDLIMLICDVIVALALYVLLVPVSKSLALLATFFRLVHTAVYGAALLSLFLVLLLVSDADHLTSLDAGLVQALVALSLEIHSFGYVVGLIFFGIHCLFLGYLVYRSGYMPRLLGILLVIASLGYLTDSFAQVLLRNYAAFETVFTIVVFGPALIAELSLCLWLIIRGVNVARWEDRALASS